MKEERDREQDPDNQQGVEKECYKVEVSLPVWVLDEMESKADEAGVSLDVYLVRVVLYAAQNALVKGGEDEF